VRQVLLGALFAILARLRYGRTCWSRSLQLYHYKTNVSRCRPILVWEEEVSLGKYSSPSSDDNQVGITIEISLILLSLRATLECIKDPREHVRAIWCVLLQLGQRSPDSHLAQWITDLDSSIDLLANEFPESKVVRV
jgi:hypothetical protein